MRALIAALLCSISLHAQIPPHLRFVESESDHTRKIVDVLQSDNGYTVTLREGDKDAVALLQEARCREVEIGYHCYIKPVRVRGILITDVIFLRDTNSHFEIKKIMLINGSFTGIAIIGTNFTLAEI